MAIRKRVDDKLASLVWNAVENHQRAFLVLIGKDIRSHVLNLYEMRSKLGTHRLSVAWCYRRDIGFAANKMKRAKQISKRKSRGTYDAEAEDPFWLFQQGTKVTYCRYRDSNRLMGNTYDFLVLQDFEAITPNVLCRVVETVAGGGLIVLAIKSVQTFQELFHKKFDILRVYDHDRTDHDRTVQDRTDQDPAEGGSVESNRYCERFIRSLSQCRNCLILNDQLDILPISRKRLEEIPDITGSMTSSKYDLRTHSKHAIVDKQLLRLQEDFRRHTHISPILNLCVTFDQAKVVAAIADHFHNLGEGVDDQKRVVSILANRGRGKSAALGLGLAIGVRLRKLERVGISAINIENVSTVFEFFIKGLEAGGITDQYGAVTGDISGVGHYLKTTWKEKYVLTNNDLQDPDFDMKDSQLATETNRNRDARICQVECLLDQSHRTIVEFVSVKEAAKLQQDHAPFDGTLSLHGGSRPQFDLLVIDEAAAVPIQLMRSILKAKSNILLASTVDGYEGTGLALTNVVLKELQQQPQLDYDQRLMQAPIRYAKRDPIESWLRSFLCLDAGTNIVGDRR
ncbi:putative N-acetyltransferase [Gregarina niphandrodes]|uniref:N-acetyltransferase n=1 Tax=Gregarina niphandrodes TaxID=110365 RepID=A0A023AXE0_GRENI|nr:putative N-acetyltransferase [Gregarina niphandrodes]EZG43113.1 putative N-acetyltransferase [Gregarina niphandrodes]|eukprot:XP_011133625.1 putative N-acetyltransferase [Gregarina niphandrodes]